MNNEMTHDRFFDRGILFVVSGPSGVGKNTIIKKALESNKDLIFIRSLTTRPMRADETPGEPYDFVSHEYFSEKIANEAMLEWQLINGYMYGSSKEKIGQGLVTGSQLITDLDVFGAHAAMLALPADICTIFIIPPPASELERRIVSRDGKVPHDLEQRMKRAIFETELMGIFDYAIPNEDLRVATRDLLGVIEAHRFRRNVFKHYPIAIRSIEFSVGHNPLAKGSENRSAGVELPKTRLGVAETKDSALHRLIKMISFKTNMNMDEIYFVFKSCEEKEVKHDSPVPYFEYITSCNITVESLAHVQRLERAINKLTLMNSHQLKNHLCF